MYTTALLWSALELENELQLVRLNFKIIYYFLGYLLSTSLGDPTLINLINVSLIDTTFFSWF